MDKIDSTLREYLSHHAQFIGAIRLPNNAFKRTANTEVTTDIVVLRRQYEGETAKEIAWRQTTPFTNSHGETIHINEYFAERPHMMLGEMRLTGRMYQRNGPTLISTGGPIAELLTEVIRHLPGNIYRHRNCQVAAPTLEQIIPAPGHVKPNAYTLVDGVIAVREGDNLKVLPSLPAQML